MTAAQLLRLSKYREAVHWLETVAEESLKTHNVDLEKLIGSCESCAQVVRHLTAQERDSTRTAALEQLSLTLSCHHRLLVDKRRQLESAGFSPAAGGASSHPNTITLSHPHTVTPSHPPSPSDGQPGNDTLAKRRQQAIRETMVHVQGVWFGSVAGLEKAKQALREAIVLPLRFPHLFTGRRKPWRRILLYGPPGTGKSLLARAVSGEVESNFYCVSSSDLLSSWVGESEKIIRDLFQHARESQGRSVVFIDEIDSVCRQRSVSEEEHTRRVKTELLRQMEGADVAGGVEGGMAGEGVGAAGGVEGGVAGEGVGVAGGAGEIFLLCATNCPWELDPAFLRRFQKRIFIPLPGREARRQLFRLHLGAEPAALGEGAWQRLLAQSEGFSGSDIATCVAEALMEPVRELETAGHWRLTEGGAGLVPCSASESGAVHRSIDDLLPHQVRPREVVAEDLFRALERGGATVGPEMLERYHTFTGRFGQTG